MTNAKSFGQELTAIEGGGNPPVLGAFSGMREVELTPRRYARSSSAFEVNSVRRPVQAAASYEQ